MDHDMARFKLIPNHQYSKNLTGKRYHVIPPFGTAPIQKHYTHLTWKEALDIFRADVEREKQGQRNLSLPLAVASGIASGVGAWLVGVFSAAGWFTSTYDFDPLKHLDKTSSLDGLSPQEVSEVWDTVVEWFGEGVVVPPSWVTELGLSVVPLTPTPQPRPDESSIAEKIHPVMTDYTTEQSETVDQAQDHEKSDESLDQNQNPLRELGDSLEPNLLQELDDALQTTNTTDQSPQSKQPGDGQLDDMLSSAQPSASVHKSADALAWLEAMDFTQAHDGDQDGEDNSESADAESETQGEFDGGTTQEAPTADWLAHMDFTGGHGQDDSGDQADSSEEANDPHVSDS